MLLDGGIVLHFVVWLGRWEVGGVRLTLALALALGNGAPVKAASILSMKIGSGEP